MQGKTSDHRYMAGGIGKNKMAWGEVVVFWYSFQVKHLKHL